VKESSNAPENIAFGYCLQKLLTPKGLLSLWEINKISGSTYGLKFFPDFFKFILKIEKLISFVGISIFFQSVPGNKSYVHISSKQERGGSQKKFENLKKKI